MTKWPCAKFTMLVTPKTRVKPMGMSAYTLPMKRPERPAWRITSRPSMPANYCRGARGCQGGLSCGHDDAAYSFLRFRRHRVPDRPGPDGGRAHHPGARLCGERGRGPRLVR